MKHPLLACALLGVTVGVTGCTKISGGSTVPPSQTPIGSYSLATVNALPLPFLVSTSPVETRELVAATMTISGTIGANTGSVSSSKDIRITLEDQEPTVVTESRTGEWVSGATSIGITWDDCTEAYAFTLNTLVGTDCELEAPVLWDRDGE